MTTLALTQQQLTAAASTPHAPLVAKQCLRVQWPLGPIVRQLLHVPGESGAGWINDPSQQRVSLTGDRSFCLGEVLEREWLVDISQFQVYGVRVPSKNMYLPCDQTCEAGDRCKDPNCHLQHPYDLHEHRDAVDPKPQKDDAPFSPYFYLALWLGKLAHWPLFVYWLQRGYNSLAQEKFNIDEFWVSRDGLHITIAYLPIVPICEALYIIEDLNKFIGRWLHCRAQPMTRLEFLCQKKYLYRGLPGGDTEYVGGRYVRLGKWSREDIETEWAAGRLGEPSELQKMHATARDFERRELDARERLKRITEQAWHPYLDRLGNYSIVNFSDAHGHFTEGCEVHDLCCWFAERLHNFHRVRFRLNWDKKESHKIQSPEQLHAAFMSKSDFFFRRQESAGV